MSTNGDIAGDPGTPGGAPGKDGAGGVGGVGGKGGTGQQGKEGKQGEPGSVHRLGLMLAGFALAFFVLLVLGGVGLWLQARALAQEQTDADNRARAARVVCEAREQQINVIAAKDAALAEAERLDVFVASGKGAGGGRPEIRQQRIDAYDAEKAGLLKTRVDCSRLFQPRGK